MGSVSPLVENAAECKISGIGEKGRSRESWAAQSLFCGPHIDGPQKIFPAYYDAMR
jgi:hypothetical protein